MITFKEHDMVVLKYNIDNMKKGSIGAIVYVYDDEFCEVEFADDESHVTKIIPFDYLKLKNF